MWNGRPYTVVTPPGKALGDSATALVVGIHGWTQTGKWACQTMAQPYVTQLGVVFLCPQGLNSYLGQSGWNTGSNGFWSADDVSYIRGATSAVLDEFAFADNLAYAIGFSMGGDMTLRLSCEASDLFSGFGVVGQSGPWATSSGMVGKAWASNCAPSPVARPIIFLSGTQDYFFGHCWEPLVIINVQVVCSLVIESLYFGIIFHRLTRGRKRQSTVLFSDKAVVRRVGAHAGRRRSRFATLASTGDTSRADAETTISDCVVRMETKHIVVPVML